MISVILSVFITAFGVFLKTTKNPGFRNSKNMANLLIALGIISFIGRLIIMYLNQRTI